MVKHLVMWKLKDFAEGANKEQNAKKIKKELEALKNRIPLIGRIEVGINMLPSEASYDVALYSEFANEKHLDTYLKHPEHIKIADCIAKLRESRVVVDYKTD